MGLARAAGAFLAEKPMPIDNAGNQYHEIQIAGNTSVRVTRVPSIIGGGPGIRVSRIEDGHVSQGLEIPDSQLADFVRAVLALIRLPTPSVNPLP
jgi:hypothetical protein